MSRVPARPSVPHRPGTPARPAHQRPSHQRPGPPRPFVVAAHRTPPRRPRRPGLCRRTWIAVLGAVFSVLLIGVMTGAAIVCASGACRGLPDPAPTRAVLELGHVQPIPVAPVTPGRLPTADPVR